jgi:hypothetical protein
MGRGAGMLTTRPTKRDKTNRFSRNMLFDIVDDGKPLGSLVFEPKTLRASIALGDKTYTVERATDRQDERLYEALIRVVTGAEKPPANPWALTDAGGSTLALGEQVKQGFAVSRGDESFSLRKVSRPFHLYRLGSDQSLGSVGQEKFFTTTLHMRLPPEFDAAFQVFLLSLVLSLTMIRLENSS